MNELDLALSDMHSNLRAARTDECARSWAKRIAAIEIDRMNGPVSDEFRACLVEVILKRGWEKQGE